MDSKPAGRVTSSRASQSQKAESPMVFSPSGNRISFRLPQPQKAESPMASRVSGRVTSCSPNRSSNRQSATRRVPGRSTAFFTRQQPTSQAKGPVTSGSASPYSSTCRSTRAVQAAVPQPLHGSGQRRLLEQLVDKGVLPPARSPAAPPLSREWPGWCTHPAGLPVRATPPPSRIS